MDTTSHLHDFDSETDEHSGVRLDSELPPEHRGRRLAIALALNVVALVVLAAILYAAIARRW